MYAIYSRAKGVARATSGVARVTTHFQSHIKLFYGYILLSSWFSIRIITDILNSTFIISFSNYSFLFQFVSSLRRPTLIFFFFIGKIIANLVVNFFFKLICYSQLTAFTTNGNKTNESKQRNEDRPIKYEK